MGEMGKVGQTMVWTHRKYGTLALVLTLTHARSAIRLLQRVATTIETVDLNIARKFGEWRP